MSFKSHLETLATIGLTPYVAASRGVLSALDLGVLGRSAHIHLLEHEKERPFHEAYRLANALAFATPAAKMPSWVLVDCILLQTAVIGFAMSRRRASDALLSLFAHDPEIDFERLDHLPVSGQIAACALDGESLVGFSLFSLRRYLPEVPALGVITKALALQAYRAQGRRFCGIAQWDNPVLAMHGRFGRPMWIEAPMVPMHPRRNMALTYGMVIDFDPDALHRREAPGPYDFLMRAGDEDKKAEIARGIEDGKRYVIAPPYQIEESGQIMLPIRVEPREPAASAPMA